MADNNNPPVEVPAINRNNIVLPLSEMVFGKKSDNAGKKFFAPVISVANFDTFKDWVGLDSIVSVVNKWMRGAFAGIYLDNIDPATGLLNEVSWRADAEDFTAGVTKLGDLEEEIEELSELQSTYALNPAFGETDSEGKPTPESEQLKTSITSVAQKLKPLRAQKALIESKYADRAAKRKVKMEAAKAAAKTSGNTVPVSAAAQ